jgi:hypothetical protein
MKEFKCYRLRGLHASIRVKLKTDICDFFHNSGGIIEEIGLPRQQRLACIGDLSHELRNSIDLAIRWSKASELHLLSDCWLEALDDIEGAWEDLLVIADSTNRQIRAPVVQLAQSFVPLLKLIKLFFNKFLILCLTKEDVRSCTDMSTQELLSFEKLAQDIAESIFSSVCRIEEAAEADQANSSRSFVQRVKSLSPLFQSLLLLSTLYVLPLLPGNKFSSSEIYFKPWLVTWYTLFFQAKNNAIKTANSLFEDLD